MFATLMAVFVIYLFIGKISESILVTVKLGSVKMQEVHYFYYLFWLLQWVGEEVHGMCYIFVFMF